MPPVKPNRVPGQQPAHNRCDRNTAGLQQQIKMVSDPYENEHRSGHPEINCRAISCRPAGTSPIGTAGNSLGFQPWAANGRDDNQDPHFHVLLCPQGMEVIRSIRIRNKEQWEQWEQWIKSTFGSSGEGCPKIGILHNQPKVVYTFRGDITPSVRPVRFAISS